MAKTYLVVATYAHDDFPLRLFVDYQKAVTFANRCKLRHTDKFLKAIGKEHTSVGKLDAIDVRIIIFTDGFATATVVVRSFDG